MSRVQAEVWDGEPPLPPGRGMVDNDEALELSVDGFFSDYGTFVFNFATKLIRSIHSFVYDGGWQGALRTFILV